MAKDGFDQPAETVYFSVALDSNFPFVGGPITFNT
jgi:hypothetical protein